MRIGVIGAGHAGVEAAAAAAASGVHVTLFSAEPIPPYFRPRLVAYAFGQVEHDVILMHPAQWYRDKGITLRLNSRVTGLNAQERSIATGREEQSFDGVVVATGSQPTLPGFASGIPNGFLTLWTAGNADSIRSRLKPGSLIVVIGGGAIGIETALRAASAGMKPVIIEKAGGLMAGRLAPAAAEVLEASLAGKGIRLLLGAGIRRTSAMDDGSALIETDRGDSVEAALAILCVGAKGNVDLARLAGLKTGAGIVVDHRLQTSVPNVFACGDAADVVGSMTCTAGAASAQGRIAGANLCAILSDRGSEMREYVRPTDATSLKVGDFELHVAGRPAGSDCEVQLLEGSDARTCRLLIVKDGRTIGVQMIGTNRDFRGYADSIGA